MWIMLLLLVMFFIISLIGLYISASYPFKEPTNLDKRVKENWDIINKKDDK